MDQQTNNYKTLGIIGGILIALIAIAVVIWKTTGTSENIVGSNATSTPTSTPPVANNKKYEDGIYTATGAYVSPNGPEQVRVALTIKDDVVTNAVFTGLGTHATTKMMQGRFSEGFREVVVGKPIDEVSLTVVNGSSLTPKGFMDALRKIKSEALVG